MSRNRDYKNFAAGGFYHVYNRGNNKQQVFLDDMDYRVFLLRLQENVLPDTVDIRKTRRQLLPPHQFDIVCYCLMPNHFHLLIHQRADVPISKLMGKVCTSYVKYFNKKYDRVGSLFQDQFKAVSVSSDKQLLWLSYYIHANPFRNIPQSGSSYAYPYSSLMSYVGERYDTLCNKNIVLDRFEGDTKKYLSSVMNFTESDLTDLLMTAGD